MLSPQWDFFILVRWHLSIESTSWFQHITKSSPATGWTSCSGHDFTCRVLAVVRSSHLHNGISYTGKITSLYWIRAQIFFRKHKKTFTFSILSHYQAGICSRRPSSSYTFTTKAVDNLVMQRSQSISSHCTDIILMEYSGLIVKRLILALSVAWNNHKFRQTCNIHNRKSSTIWLKMCINHQIIAMTLNE